MQPPPWNILLRMTARLAGHVVGLLLIPPGGEGPDRRGRRGAGDDDAGGDDRRTNDDDDNNRRINEDDTTMHGGGTEDALLLPSLSSSTAVAATVEDAVTAAMRSTMRALDVVEARLRSLLDSADADIVTTAAVENGMMRDWVRRAYPRDDDLPSSGPSSLSSSSSGAVFAVVDIRRRDAVVGRREIWGPSRYAFLRDVDSETGMMTTMIGGGGLLPRCCVLFV